MFTVELYAAIRRAVMIEGLSRREAARRFGVHRNTITRMIRYSAPPGYRRRERPVSKKLGSYMAWIDKVRADDRSVHKKQRHTAKRIFARLRDEEAFSGVYEKVALESAQDRADYGYVSLWIRRRLRRMRLVSKRFLSRIGCAAVPLQVTRRSHRGRQHVWRPLCYDDPCRKVGMISASGDGPACNGQMAPRSPTAGPRRRLGPTAGTHL